MLLEVCFDFTSKSEIFWYCARHA